MRLGGLDLLEVAVRLRKVDPRDLQTGGAPAVCFHANDVHEWDIRELRGVNKARRNEMTQYLPNPQPSKSVPSCYVSAPIAPSSPHRSAHLCYPHSLTPPHQT